MEEKIVYETENLYLYQVKNGFEIRLNGVTHSVVVGECETKIRGIRIMKKLEKYPGNLRVFHNHS